MNITTISTYVKAHEKLILAAIVGLVLWVGIGHIEGIIAAHDNVNLVQAKIVAQSQADKNAAIAEQVAIQAEQYKALAVQVNAQNAALEQANVNLANALIKQQRTDATLPPSELAKRWAALVPGMSEIGMSWGATDMSLPHASAVATVQQLEEVPVLKTELSNSNKKLENVDTLLTASTGQITTLNSSVDGLRLQIVDNAKVCTAQIAVVKAEARRSKRRWFIVGYVAGFISRQYIKTATGF